MGYQYSNTTKLKRLDHFNGIMVALSPTFVAKQMAIQSFILAMVQTTELKFHCSKRARQTNPLAWLSTVLSGFEIKRYSASMSFSDQGAMQISIDSGTATYDYILPARSQ